MTITLHALPPSHPCMTAEAAMKLKGVAYERVDLTPGPHVEQMKEIYGAHTVPGALFDGEPVHTSRAILARLNDMGDGPDLYPSDAVREAERWGDEELQDLGRRLPWGALHFRPEALGTFAGGQPLDPAGTDFAMKYVRSTWKYHGLTCEMLAADLAGLPEKVDHIAGLLSDGVIGGSEPNAADLQIGATVRVLLTIGDLRPVLEPVSAFAREWFPDYAGDVPAGAYPAGWV